jgi:hypothetical protein
MGASDVRLRLASEEGKGCWGLLPADMLVARQSGLQTYIQSCED